MQRKRPRPSLVNPLILITMGVLLLLNQMGKLPVDIWWSLWRYWPVILILLGIETIIKASRSRLLYLLGLLIALAVMGGLIGYAVLRGGASTSVRPATGTETLAHSLQDAGSGQVTLRLGAGAVNVGTLADSPNFVEGKIEYAEQSRQAEQSFTVRNGRAEFDLRSHQENSLWTPGTNSGETWQLRFTPRVPLEMRMEIGAGSVKADLSGLQVTRLDLNVGVGSATVTLPAVEGTASAYLKLAIGEVTVRVPSGVGVKISTSRLLSSLHVDESRFSRSGDSWVSNNYATSTSKLDVRIDNVLGSINIQ
jgi:hypothetical protein